MNNYVNPKDTANTLDLTPEMIDLMTKAKISLEKSIDELDYHINIIKQLHDHMNKHAKKY